MATREAELNTTRKRLVGGLVAVLVALAVLYFGLPKLAGLHETWGRLRDGDPWWLGVAVGLEACSYAGYLVLFRGVFIRRGSRIGWRESYQITMAGVAATRLLAMAGAGGVALTVWALRRSGMDRREVGQRMTTFLVALYAVFMTTMLIDGIALRTGIFPGTAPFGVTVVPAAFAGALIAATLSAALVPPDLDRRLPRSLRRHERLERWSRRLAAGAGTVAGGVRGGIGMLRARDPSLLGAVAWWAFDIAVLWACFHAFGEPPPKAVLVMGYFVGQLANVLPLPGGVGGVEGGMIAAFLAFDVTGGLAVVAVLSYRAFAFWLPTLPGGIAYLQLRRTVRDWREQEEEEPQRLEARRQAAR